MRAVGSALVGFRRLSESREQVVAPTPVQRSPHAVSTASGCSNLLRTSGFVASPERSSRRLARPFRASQPGFAADTSRRLSGATRGRIAQPHRRSTAPLGFLPLQHIRNRGSGSRGVASPRHLPPSGFLPSRRFTPPDPLPGLFRPGQRSWGSTFRALLPAGVGPPSRESVLSCRLRRTRPSASDAATEVCSALPVHASRSGLLGPPQAVALLAFVPLGHSIPPSRGSASRPLLSCASFDPRIVRSGRDPHKLAPCGTRGLGPASACAQARSGDSECQRTEDPASTPLGVTGPSGIPHLVARRHLAAPAHVSVFGSAVFLLSC